MGKTKALSLLAAGMLLFSATDSLAVKVDPRYLISPGKGVGAIKLSMPKSEVMKLLGNPNFSQKVAPDFAFAQWERQGLFVGFDGDSLENKVVLISVSNHKFSTDNGAKVGLKVSLLKKHYPLGKRMPDAKNITDWHDDRLGIGFIHRTHGNTLVNPAEDWVCDEIDVFSAARIVNPENPKK
ncbi:MAG TPA: hypothetical protein V6C82_06930 [Chroococcales cyanobacterium]